MSDDKMEAKQRFLLKKSVKELSKYRARHTELVSVYIPAGFDINKIITQLTSEQSTARNIKSATTRKNVTDALEKMIRELRVIGRTPPNGLAIFAGNVSEREGGSDVCVWSVEPPIPLKLRDYKCGQAFSLEPLGELGDEVNSYGLLVLDRREANLAELKGKAIIPMKHFTSSVPGKMKAGGQSAQRFRRVTENLAKDFFKKVGKAANEEFMKMDIVGVIIGGPGPTKEDFARGNFLSPQLKERIIGIVNTGYTGDFGLEETVSLAGNLIGKEDVIKEKKLLERFFNVMGKSRQLVATGEKEVMAAFEANAVDIVLISDTFDDDKAEDIINKAEAGGSDWVVVSMDTREGEQLEGIGGIGAILRFQIRK